MASLPGIILKNWSLNTGDLKSFNFTNILNIPGGLDGKVSSYSAGDLGLIPGSGISPGEGNGNPLQDSCMGNPMDGGVW